MLIALGVKVLSAIVFFLVYTYYYSNREETDMYRYYDDAKIMYSATDENTADYFKMMTGFQDKSENIYEQYYVRMNTWHKSYDYFVRNDNRTMVRINAFLMLFSFGSVYVHMFFFMMLGFIGTIWIFKTLKSDNPVKDKILFFFLMFFPSFVFWTSNISKEALLIFALGGFLYSLKKLTQRPFKAMFLLWIAVFTYFMLSMKIYVLFCLIPAMIAFVWTKLSSNRFAFFKYAIVFAVYIALLWNFHHIFPTMKFLEAFVRKQHDFVHFAQSIDAGSMLQVKMLEPNIVSVLCALPGAMLTVLFRPFFFDSDNLFMFFISIENLLFVAFLVFCFLFRNKNFKPDQLFWTNMFFAFFFFSLIGLATPVLGAVVRYKIVAYPFLLAALISLTDSELIKKKLPFFFKNMST